MNRNNNLTEKYDKDVDLVKIFFSNYSKETQKAFKVFRESNSAIEIILKGKEYAKKNDAHQCLKSSMAGKLK